MKLLCEVDSSSGDFELVYQSLYNFDLLKSETFTLEKEKQLQLTQSRFEFDESQCLQHKLILENETSEKFVRYQRTIIVGVCVILFLSAWMSFLFSKQGKKRL